MNTNMKYALVILSFISIVAKADRTDIPEVSIGHFIVGSITDFPAIQTYGLSTCIGVTLYDSSRRQGALLHVSSPVDIPLALEKVLSEMENNGSAIQNIQAQLYGGWDISMDNAGLHFTSELMANTLLSELNNRGVSVIANQTLVTKTQIQQGASYNINIELDLMTGAVYQFSQTVNYFSGDISRKMPVTSEPGT